MTLTQHLPTLDTAAPVALSIAQGMGSIHGHRLSRGTNREDDAMNRNFAPHHDLGRPPPALALPDLWSLRVDVG